MNVRHLEIFYHVVRNAGINRAVGRMPFGIQQPAISEQIQLLEDSLQCRLFQRNPFRLTPEGNHLYQYAREFFEALTPMSARLRGGLRQHVRIGADEMLVQSYLSVITRKLTWLDSTHTFAICSSTSAEMPQRLQDGSVDLILGLSGDHVPRNLCSRTIATCPLVLVVDESSPVQSAEQLWTGAEISLPLMCTGPIDAIAQSFYRGLKHGGVKWRTTTTVPSVASVRAFVVGCDAIGVSLDAPFVNHSGMRILPLKGFDPVHVSAFWMSADTGRLKNLVRCIRSTAHLLSHVRTQSS